MSDWKDRAQQVIQGASMQAYKQANSRMPTCPRQSIGLGLDRNGVLRSPDGPSRPAQNINEVR